MVSDHKDIMTYILPDGESKGLIVPEIEANGFILIFAGAETSASVLSAAVFYLMRHLEKTLKLRGKLKNTFQSSSYITFKSTGSLPYLNVVIQETLRLTPSAVSSLTRQVSKGGANVCGEHPPAGVSQFSIITLSALFAHVYLSRLS